MKQSLIIAAAFFMAGVISLASTSTYAQRKKAETKAPATAPAAPVNYVLNDSHFHLTNYIQEGIGINKFLEIMGNKVGRVALFGIPFSNNGHLPIPAILPLLIISPLMLRFIIILLPMPL